MQGAPGKVALGSAHKKGVERGQWSKCPLGGFRGVYLQREEKRSGVLNSMNWIQV